MQIVLDFGDRTTVLNEKHYDCKVSGNWLAVICKATGKRWIYRIIGCGFSKDQMRYRVKEAYVPKVKRRDV
ncbi:MAG: hypothetical protein GXO22_07365 [Aquificae bacterium]|nr:hypothetical protein [Aquificota bacterium]